MHTHTHARTGEQTAESCWVSWVVSWVVIVGLGASSDPSSLCQTRVRRMRSLARTGCVDGVRLWAAARSGWVLLGFGLPPMPGTSEAVGWRAGGLLTRRRPDRHWLARLPPRAAALSTSSLASCLPCGDSRGSPAGRRSKSWRLSITTRTRISLTMPSCGPQIDANAVHAQQGRGLVTL